MAAILITGGTGAFGKAFVKRILKEYDRICIYSRDEYKQFQMRQEIGDYEKIRYFIGDVRDYKRLRRACEGIDVIVHAAALKRIETGVYNADEMVKTNILGSMNVIEAAHEAKVKKVVFLSTDKAYQPASPYGHSKALAESLILAANNVFGEHGPRFSVTRYGNVAGSTGSVIPVWRKMIDDYGPYTEKKHGCPMVPVTDPDCTRFWMTMDEAIDLVQKCIKYMPNYPLIPELPAFRLGDLAEAMGAKMNIVGLPKHEKKHECMSDGNCSNTAKLMTVDELREELGKI